MKWNRQSKNPIELKDTPEMNAFALSMGWTKEPARPTKKPTKKAE